jgi:hypothetical protein
VYPALVVRRFEGTDAVNLQVFFDGDCSYWATSRRSAGGAEHEPGTWSAR